jgi:hypothetical protein
VQVSFAAVFRVVLHRDLTCCRGVCRVRPHLQSQHGGARDHPGSWRPISTPFC